jgi:predicted aconitase with swiveling domain
MGMSWQAEVLFEGDAEGEVMRFDAPISFWGGVNPVTSKITLAGHPQRGQAIKDKVLVIPQLIGSSSSSAVILELFYKGMAPKALILGGRDAILPVGVVVARQMGWPTIPVMVLPDPPFRSGDILKLAPDGHIEKV